MRHDSNRWYSDVTSHRTTPGEPCRNYTPYSLPDGSLPNGRIAYVLKDARLEQTGGKGLERLAKRLTREGIRLARSPTAMELSVLEGKAIPTLPKELTDIVNAALSQKTAAPTSYTANSAPL